MYLTGSKMSIKDYIEIKVNNKKTDEVSDIRFLSSQGAFISIHILNGYYRFNLSFFMMACCNFKCMFKDNLELFLNIRKRLMHMVLLGCMQNLYQEEC